MPNKNEERGNALDAAPKGPRLPGKKTPMPLPKREPVAVPTTPAPETPVSAVREIKEITPVETPAPAVEVAPAVAPTGSSEASTYETVRKAIEATHQASTEAYEEMRRRIDAEPLAAAQLAEAVNDYTEEMRKHREAGNPLPIADDPVLELTLEAPLSQPPTISLATEPPPRMKSADTLLPDAEAIAERKDEEAFFARGEKMGQRSALRPRLRRTIITHHVTVANPQPAPPEREMTHSTDNDTTITAAPETPPSPPEKSKGFRRREPEMHEHSRSTDRPAVEEEKKGYNFVWGLVVGLFMGAIMVYVGTCALSSGTKSDEKATTDTAGESVTTPTATARPAAPAATASATVSEQPVSRETAPGTYTPTNALLAEAAAANGGKWHGDVSCYYTDWTPVSDDAPWVDCSSQKKKDLAGPKPDCFKVADCKVIFP